MIINSNISPFVVLDTSSLGDVLERISLNKKGVVFVVNDAGILEGVLTDGDVRNWLKITTNWDVSQTASNICNKNFVSRNNNTSFSEIESIFSDEIRFVPLTDRLGRLVSIAFNELNSFSISTYNISEANPSFIIAEIGNNHNGSLNLAKKLIDEAVQAGANCAKFQMRNLEVTYRQDADKSADEDLGTEYTLDLLSRFQLTKEDLFEAFDYCKEKGILPLCTPFDHSSLVELERYGMPAYKLASADLTNHDLIRKMCETRKPIICSTGMSTESEIVDAVQLMKSMGASFALMHCNSTYPAPFKDINLNYLTRLKEIGNCEIGYSGHERNYSVPIAAVAKGARIIEKHFTMDRSMEGNDHRVSLLPDEFAGMVTSIREVEQALGNAETRRITQGEMMNRETLAKSLIAAKAVIKGSIITDDDLDVRSPGKGLSPYLREKLVGKVISRDIKAGDFFFPSDIEDTKIEPRPYDFKRPFGIPVRYHDFKQILGKSNFDLLEFHLSYKDLELNPKDFLDKDGYDLDFVVHSPELFANDHIMDLCSADPIYRKKSIAELQRVINITLLLKPYFKKALRPKIIINAGGYSLDKLIPQSERINKYILIADAFKALDLSRVEIIPQTMPPFPWHFGGQRFHNLFMIANEIVHFCKSNNMRVCLDISHSKLVCNKEHQSFKEFLELVAPYSAHIHVVDAEGVDGEGLQIHEGDIDFSLVGSILDLYCPEASFIPEVWQGHKNECEGFWIALERLEKYL
jgi:sialic acid synthase SpsE/sugar phosphate isomerase/epimerase